MAGANKTAGSSVQPGCNQLLPAPSTFATCASHNPALIQASTQDHALCSSHAVLSAWQVTRLKGVRERLGLPAEERGPEEVEVAAGVHGLSQIELDAFVDLTVQRYQTKRMDPGNTLIY